MTSCRGTISRVVLCAVNMISIVLALTVILVGFQMYESVDGTFSSSSEHLILGLCTWHTLAITTIIIGVVIFLASIVGLCVAICESPALLNFYVYFIAMHCCIVLVGNFCFWFCSSPLADKASNYFHQLVTNSSFNDDAMDVVQKVQLWAYCCGEQTFEDWQNQTWTNRSIDSSVELRQFPASCCDKPWSAGSDVTNQTNSIVDDCTGSQVVFYDGCFSSAQLSRYQMFGQNLFVLVLFFLFLVLVLSCCLDRDRQLEASKLINIQYAAHLHVCRPPSDMALGPTAASQRYASVNSHRRPLVA